MTARNSIGRWRSLLFSALWAGFLAVAPPPVVDASSTGAIEEIAIPKDETQHQPLWAEIYAECESLPYESHNPVLDLSIRAGIHEAKINGNDLDLYLKGRIFADKDRLYWNNRYEFGLGSRYRPFTGWGLILFAEVLSAGYTGRENQDEPNPSDATYLDIQGGLAFWNWWGRQPWQIGDAIEFYLPLTGWREVYGDCVYYHHRDNVTIVTAEYKEGLLLGHIGRMGLDAYIAFELHWDTKDYEWNNYTAAGMGFRVKPFEKLDLKIGAEYLSHHFYRGAYNDVEEYHTGFVFSLAWWHGW